ncbi:MAG: glycosyltransferase family 25 protein [Holosporaceae bacterium]|jgi:GR25 family glycosyltransferase involved in LPS biosynthesis|nr:glycosyltransferase family 25 protein [Holosporaceae bacterium]
MKKLLLLFAIVCFPAENSQKTEAYDIVYVINLDRTPERFEKTNDQLCKSGIKCLRFSAVDGYLVKLSDQSSGEVISGKESGEKIKKYFREKHPVLYRVTYGGKYKSAEFDLFVKYRRFSAGEIGVTYSHRAIWADVVKNNRQNVVVFEDDVILSENFKKDLEELIHNIPEDADITFIGVGRRPDKRISYPNIDNIFRNFDHVPGNDVVAKIQPTNFVYGMYAYIVSAKGAKKLLELTNRSEYQVDDIIFQQGGINKGIIKAYVAKKKMCYPDCTNSEIRKMGRSF